MVRDWLKRDELADELFDMLDCIGKGYSFTEIVWDSSEGQWRPARLEWRDPRWFRFDRTGLATPLMLDDVGQETPLEPFKFIFAAVKAKSGIALRSGLARAAAWAWMFKAFTQRDWAIFTQTYGQPLRLGKYGPGASEAEKATLFRAVANIAGDCAAIIPESMVIDFVETKSVGATADLYKQRADWLDQQISKAVLGQTATTDAVTGGLGSPVIASRSCRNLIDAGEIPDTIEAIRREHSRKPVQMREMIGQLLPRSYACELFAREPWAGHDVWGNETGRFPADEVSAA